MGITTYRDGPGALTISFEWEGLTKFLDFHFFPNRTYWLKFGGYSNNYLSTLSFGPLLHIELQQIF